MINIFDNFSELEITKNTALLSKLKISKFTSETLENMLKLSILTNNDLQKLDHFLENNLKLFPQLFPSIILEQTQSKPNLSKRKKAFNSRQQKIVDDKIAKNKPADEILNSYNEKKYISDGDTNEFLDDIDKEITFRHIEDEILSMVQEQFHQQFLDTELKKLSKIITAEIYLRTKTPEEYVNTGDFKEFKNAYYTAINQHNTQIVEKLELAADKGSSKEELSSLLQKELLK